MKPSSGRIRILILIDSLVGGGTQQALYDYLRHADHDRLHIRVVALTSASEVFAERIRRHAELDFVHGKKNGIGTLIDPFFWSRLSRLIVGFGPHILHARLEGSLFFGSVLSRFFKIPAFVYTIEASRRQMALAPARIFFWRIFFLKNASAIFTGYPDEYRSMGLPAEKMRVYEAAMDLDEAASRPQAIVSDQAFVASRPILMSVGRLHPDKGHQYAIRLMGMIRTILPSARLYICGEGDFRSELERLIELDNLEDCVHILGYVPGVDWLLQRADAYLAFMVNEPLNLAAARAMAWGLPILAFRTGLHSHVRIEEGVNGSAMPLGDLSEAPDRLRHLLDTTDRNAVRRLAALPSNREAAQRYDMVYLNLSGTSKG